MSKKEKLRLKGRLKTYIQAPFLLGLILVFVNIGIFLMNARCGLVLSAFTVIYLITILFMALFARPPLNAELVNFATEYGQIQKRLLRELELPHALLDESGRIVWMNTAFERLGDKDRFYKKNIHSFMPEFKREQFPEGSDTKELSISYEDKDYLARIKRIELKDMAALVDKREAGDYKGFLYAVYLFDRTALNLALTELDNQSLVVGFIYIDNYEEALESVEDVGRSLLGAFIDRQVNQYVNDLDGVLTKMEKDKYLVIMRKSALSQAREDKFRLLEDVKSISVGNEISVTLSIGIGMGGLSYAQNREFARNAMDLALGRGGDQAVVKDKDSVSYYGGKSQQKETTTRVRARVKAQAMEEIISGKDLIFVMGHRNGDADSFGAAVGVRAAAVSLQKKCHIVLENVTPSLQPLVDLYKSQPEYEQSFIVDSNQALELAEGANCAVVVVDVNRPAITECPELLKRCKSIIVLDHHRQGTEVVENATLSYVEPNASSASEMVSEILQYIGNGVKFKSVVADCLYAGIVMDTQSFTTKTGVRTFEAAAFLRRSGADVTRVRKMFRDDAADYMAKAEAIRKAEVYRKDFVISFCPSEGLKSPTVVAAQAANDLLNINGVKASFVLTEYQNQIFISARSIDEVNVQIIMEKLGGGGHMTSSGAQLKNTTIEAGIIMIKNTLDTMIAEGEL